MTFGEVASTSSANPKTRLYELIDPAKIADQAEIDTFGLGKHHRKDFAISSPPALLAAITDATERIRLTSTVTQLLAADPVKAYEDFASLDLFSGGRAGITAARGVYIESIPHFGCDLSESEDLFEEKLSLFTQVVKDECVSRRGKFRASLDSAGICPRTMNSELPL